MADDAGRWCTGFDDTDLYTALEGGLLADALGIYILDMAGTVTHEWTWTGGCSAPQGTGEEVRLAGGLVERTSDGSVRVTDQAGNLLYRRNDYPDRWRD